MSVTTNKIYKGASSGVIVEALNGVDGATAEKLQEVVENTQDAAVEKHVPVVEKVAGGYKVSVGEVDHPMADEHYIEWIELTDGVITQRKALKPGEAPVAVFLTESSDVVARAYCNLHGLWKSA